MKKKFQKFEAEGRELAKSLRQVTATFLFNSERSEQFVKENIFSIVTQIGKIKWPLGCRKLQEKVGKVFVV